ASGGTCRRAPGRRRERRGRCPGESTSSSAANHQVRCPPRSVDSGREERVSVLTQPLGCVLELARLPLQQAVHDPWMRRQKSLELGSRQHETAQWGFRHDVGNWHLAEQTGDLAEVIAGFQRAPVDVVDADPGGSLENDVEARSADALAEDSLALREKRLIKKVRDLFELWPGKVSKQR